MNLIINTILKEKRRIEYMLDEYRGILSRLPKGSVSSVEKNGKVYYYLKYRDGKKIITKYLGKDAGEIETLVEKRKHIEVMIKSLEGELKIAQKALEGNV